MTVRRVVVLSNGRYTIDIGATDEKKPLPNPYAPYASGFDYTPTGRKLDKLNGCYQQPGGQWRGCSFHIDLERAKALRELLDDYIAVKEAEKSVNKDV